jgi:hypothetical protein
VRKERPGFAPKLHPSGPFGAHDRRPGARWTSDLCAPTKALLWCGSLPCPAALAATCHDLPVRPSVRPSRACGRAPRCFTVPPVPLAHASRVREAAVPRSGVAVGGWIGGLPPDIETVRDRQETTAWELVCPLLTSERRKHTSTSCHSHTTYLVLVPYRYLAPHALGIVMLTPNALSIGCLCPQHLTVSMKV